MVFLIESESYITYITPKKQNLLFEAERFKEQNQLYRFFWAKNSTSLRKNEGFRPIKIICRRTFLVSISIFSTLFHFISLFHRGIWYLACEQQTQIRSSLRSLRKIASANPSGKSISVTWSLLFWCWPTLTLNADFFMKQLLLKLCMWCGPFVSLYKIRLRSTWHKQNLDKIIAKAKGK